MKRHQRIEALIAEAYVSREYATVLTQAGGRCEYCGADLLTDRLGYGAGRVDQTRGPSCPKNWNPMKTEHHLTTGSHDHQIATELAPLRHRETGGTHGMETLSHALRETFCGNKGGPVVASER